VEECARIRAGRSVGVDDAQVRFPQDTAGALDDLLGVVDGNVFALGDLLVGMTGFEQQPDCALLGVESGEQAFADLRTLQGETCRPAREVQLIDVNLAFIALPLGAAFAARSVASDCSEPALEPADVIVLREQVGQPEEDIVDDLAGVARRERVDGAVEPIAEAAAQLAHVGGLAGARTFQQLVQCEARNEQLVGRGVRAELGNGRLRGLRAGRGSGSGSIGEQDDAGESGVDDAVRGEDERSLTDDGAVAGEQVEQ
jgi:hypothetical protein